MILNLYNCNFENDDLQKLIEATNSDANEIIIYIRSCGGLNSINNAMLDIVNSNPSRFKIVGTGYLASCGFDFFVKAECEKKILNPTLGMFHQFRQEIDIDERMKPYYPIDSEYQKLQKNSFPESLEFIQLCGFTKKETNDFKKNKDVFFQHNRLKEIIETYKHNTTKKNSSEKEIPDEIKTELKVGKWYKHIRQEQLFCITKISDNAYGYGFNKKGTWISYTDDRGDFCVCNAFFFEGLIVATQQEVSSALIAEAKKRGFVEGAKFKSSISENGKIRTVTETDSWFFCINHNFLTISTPSNEWNNAESNPIIFEEGKWAEIIQ